MSEWSEMQGTVLFLSLGTYLYFFLARVLKVGWNFFHEMKLARRLCWGRWSQAEEVQSD